MGNIERVKRGQKLTEGLVNSIIDKANGLNIPSTEPFLETPNGTLYSSTYDLSQKKNLKNTDPLFTFKIQKFYPLNGERSVYNPFPYDYESPLVKKYFMMFGGWMNSDLMFFNNKPINNYMVIRRRVAGNGGGFDKNNLIKEALYEDYTNYAGEDAANNIHKIKGINDGYIDTGILFGENEYPEIYLYIVRISEDNYTAIFSEVFDERLILEVLKEGSSDSEETKSEVVFMALACAPTWPTQTDKYELVSYLAGQQHFYSEKNYVDSDVLSNQFSLDEIIKLPEEDGDKTIVYRQLHNFDVDSASPFYLETNKYESESESDNKPKYHFLAKLISERNGQPVKELTYLDLQKITKENVDSETKIPNSVGILQELKSIERKRDENGIDTFSLYDFSEQGYDLNVQLSNTVNEETGEVKYDTLQFPSIEEFKDENFSDITTGLDNVEILTRLSFAGHKRLAYCKWNIHLEPFFLNKGSGECSCDYDEEINEINGSLDDIKDQLGGLEDELSHIRDGKFWESGGTADTCYGQSIGYQKNKPVIDLVNKELLCENSTDPAYWTVNNLDVPKRLYVCGGALESSIWDNGAGILYKDLVSEIGNFRFSIDSTHFYAGDSSLWGWATTQIPNESGIFLFKNILIGDDENTEKINIEAAEEIFIGDINNNQLSPSITKIYGKEIQMVSNKTVITPDLVEIQSTGNASLAGSNLTLNGYGGVILKADNGNEEGLPSGSINVLTDLNIDSGFKLKIGDTELTESKLQQLLALIGG